MIRWIFQLSIRSPAYGVACSNMSCYPSANAGQRRVGVYVLSIFHNMSAKQNSGYPFCSRVMCVYIPYRYTNSRVFLITHPIGLL